MADVNVESALKFGLALDRYVKQAVPAKAALVHRFVTLDALKRIVLKTPVATGRARGNWQTSIGAPTQVALTTVDPSGDAVLAQGQSAIADVKPFEVVFISNNLIYIVPLENGHSKQAPSGMVAVTLAELELQLGSAAPAGGGS